ncbi:uncharacterized protein LOC115736227 [Rhodamnia argentea]|uniref:Uncharacterized protein LOC115736227 n=1 Tax=Rhodamnia argentea TaxID=178133 RepID=A0A8B8NMD6_9MYRT|nr:uncharacterized protein LOC115736227 [Rhodamnia argentea]
MGFFSALGGSKSAFNALPRFSRSVPTPAAPPNSLRQGSSFFTRCGRPRASAQLSPFIYRYQAKIPAPQPLPAGRNRSDAERVVEAIQHEQVRVEEKTKAKRDQCSLLSLGISDDGVSRSCKMRVWRNLDEGPPSWTVRLDGPGWQASVLDFPDLSAGGKIAASPDEIGHTMASDGAERLVQDICLVIHHIQFLEKRCKAGFFSSIFPKVKMIMKDRCLLIGIRMPPSYFMIGVFCLLAALAIRRLYRV